MTNHSATPKQNKAAIMNPKTKYLLHQKTLLVMLLLLSNVSASGPGEVTELKGGEGKMAQKRVSLNSFKLDVDENALNFRSDGDFSEFDEVSSPKLQTSTPSESSTTRAGASKHMSLRGISPVRLKTNSERFDKSPLPTAEVKEGKKGFLSKLQENLTPPRSRLSGKLPTPKLLKPAPTRTSPDTSVEQILSTKCPAHREAFFQIFQRPLYPQVFSNTLCQVAQVATEIQNTPTYQRIQDHIAEWGLIGGWLSPGPKNPNGMLMESVITPAVESRDFQYFLREMAQSLMRSDSSRLDGQYTHELSSHIIAENARLFVARLIGSTSNLPLEMNEAIVGNDQLRVIGTQKEVFFRPGLLRVAAMFAVRFDPNHAAEVFDFFVKKRMPGVWGPTRDELYEIAKVNWIPEERMSEALAARALKYLAIKEAYEKALQICLNSPNESENQSATEADVEQAIGSGDFKEFIKTNNRHHVAGIIRQVLVRGRKDHHLVNRIRASFIGEAPSSSPLTHSASCEDDYASGKTSVASEATPRLSECPRTLEDVLDGALRIIFEYHADYLSRASNLATSKFGIESLQNFFINIYGHQNSYSIVQLCLNLGVSHPQISDFLGEYVYAAFLLTQLKYQEFRSLHYLQKELEELVKRTATSFKRIHFDNIHRDSFEVWKASLQVPVNYDSLSDDEGDYSASDFDERK